LPLHTHINTHAHCAICHLWIAFANRTESQLETLDIRFWRWKATGRLTRLSEVVYQSTRLGGRLEIRARHESGSHRTVYKEVLGESEGEERKIVVFEV